MTARALVLARGLGTRMRQDADVALDSAQRAAAEAGMKAFMPMSAGRPFLDYALTTLADAGVTRVCLIIGPEHEQAREYYLRQVATARLHIDTAIQPEPRGTADALLAAESWTAGEPFLVVNGDNCYPASALRALAELELPGLIAFSRDGLLADGHIPADRIARFALLDLDGARLRRIVEKPDAAQMAAMGGAARVSMNAWRFDARVFDACRAVPLSPRGELELPMAVAWALEHDAFPLEAVFSDEGVLDLSSRGDVAAVMARLADMDVRL